VGDRRVPQHNGDRLGTFPISEYALARMFGCRSERGCGPNQRMQPTSASELGSDARHPPLGGGGT
jgi:hypothetical protein